MGATNCNILAVARVQGPRPCKYILNLPHRSNVSYKERLEILCMIPCVTGMSIGTWFTYANASPLIMAIILQTKFHAAREIRNTNSNGVLLNEKRCRTVNFQQSYYVRATNVWNTLPSSIQDPSLSIVPFKRTLFEHFKDLTDRVFDLSDPRTFKTVCVKCHSNRSLTNLANHPCCI